MMDATPNFPCKRSQRHLHSRMNECSPWNQCRHLYAAGSSLWARLAWKVIHFTRCDKWSHRLLAPFRRQTDSCVKEIHFSTFNKRGAGGSLNVISSVSRAEEPSQTPPATLSWSERARYHHYVVKIYSLLQITYILLLYHLHVMWSHAAFCLSLQMCAKSLDLPPWNICGREKLTLSGSKHREA